MNHKRQKRRDHMRAEEIGVRATEITADDRLA